MKSDRKSAAGLIRDCRAPQVDIDPVTGNMSFYMGEIVDVTADATLDEESSHSPGASEK